MPATEPGLPLPLEDYKRYGRQMILDGFGLPGNVGQVKLSKASVAVVGAGGLGCAALQYLGAAGIGKIGIFDHDRVEVSNLQRQILHSEDAIGTFKAESAKNALLRLNSRLVVDAVTTAISSGNATLCLAEYDIIVDCTDNVPTRYLLSDTAVALGKPLVSGAAQKFDGQLCVYNFGTDGPCYRCVFPVPPKPGNVGTCEELGILGPVTGIIGNMQAMETIKILTGLQDFKATMLIYNAVANPPFRTIKLRSRRPSCPSCGKEGDKFAAINATDYIQFCGGAAPDWEERGLQQRDTEGRITAKQLKTVLDLGQKINLLDVRPATEFGICSLPESRNVSLKDILQSPEKYASHSPDTDTLVLCRLGNDSQIAAEALRRIHGAGKVQDVIGGLRAWSTQVDGAFPQY